MLLIRVSVDRCATRQDVISRRSSDASLRSLASISRSGDHGSLDGDTDSDFASEEEETHQISSSSGPRLWGFRQVPLDLSSSTDALPLDQESTPLSDFEHEPLPSSEPEPLPSSDFESLPSSDHESSSGIADSLCDSDSQPIRKRQKRTHLTSDRLLTQIGLQQQADDQSSSSSRPSRSSQAAPKQYARIKRSYTKRK